jgi:hypothetical protein
LSSYSFTKIAGTTDGLTTFGEAPALSNDNAGNVAFLATSPQGQTCLFLGNGGRPFPLFCVGPGDGELGAFPSINGGTVAFLFRSGQVQYIIAANRVLDRLLYSTQDPFFRSLGSPSLNNEGQVAFRAETSLRLNSLGVFAGDGQTTTRIDGLGPDIVDFGDFPSLQNLPDPSVPTPTVAYKRVDPYTSRESINLGTGGQPRELYSTNYGTFFLSFGDPVLNSTNTVAFFATIERGPALLSGIFAGDGGPVTIIATIGNGFDSFGPHPAINNGGAVAFLANLTGSGSGIFVGSKSDDLNPVIVTGDALFDSTVTDLHFFREGLNDAGQVTFLASTADGNSYIVRADPSNPGGGGQGGGGGGAIAFLGGTGSSLVLGQPGSAVTTQEALRPSPREQAPPAVSAGAELVALPATPVQHARDMLFAIPQSQRAWEESEGPWGGPAWDLPAFNLLGWQ